MNQRGWVLLVVALVSVLGGAWWFSSRAVEEAPRAGVGTAPAPTSPPPAPPPARGDDGQPVEAPVAAPAPAPTPGPSFAPDGKMIPRNPKNPVEPAQLEQETALLDAARASVRSDPEGALRSITEHRQKFPDGALAEDVELLEVEAYLRLNRKNEAEVLAKKLVAKDPLLKKKVDRLLDRVRPR